MFCKCTCVGPVFGSALLLEIRSNTISRYAHMGHRVLPGNLRAPQGPLNKIVNVRTSPSTFLNLSLSMPVDDSPCKRCGQVFPYSDTPSSFCSKCEAIATEQIDSPGYIAINVCAS
jgi:hypothetical protein